MRRFSNHEHLIFKKCNFNSFISIWLRLDEILKQFLKLLLTCMCGKLWLLNGEYANGCVEHIADSYRDDLLREVALMKTIGRHSNIVSIVGACTARRPIALIMEYVPYGNLQNFLKFVRLLYL